MENGEKTMLRVFLCHASEDKPDVRDLYNKLSKEDWIIPWLDEKNILPGQDWDTEIESAVESADVVIVFLSSLSILKDGYVQRELKFILGIALEKPEGTIFIIPLRLDDCKPPRRVRTWHYVDYFPETQRDDTYQHLLTSLKVRLEQKQMTEEKMKSFNIQNQKKKEQAAINNKLNILFLGTQQADSSNLNHGLEVREIKEKLESSKFGDKFIFEEKYPLYLDDIRGIISDVQPKIVHFLERNPTSGEVYLDELIGKKQEIVSEDLSIPFEQFSDQISVVILSKGYFQQQAKAISKHIDYVLFMSEGVNNTISVEFSIGFYTEVCKGSSIPDAYRIGISQILLHKDRDYELPILLKKKTEVPSSNKSPETLHPKQEGKYVIPTGGVVRIQDWTKTSVPSAYAFIGELGTPPNPHFFRQKDAHISVLVSETPLVRERFLIDKYAITCQQFCNFLNDICDKGDVITTNWNNENQAIFGNHTLVIDAFDHWKKLRPNQPWLHAPQPFGVTYKSRKWTPLPESDMLPVTLVTWWGARLYSLWAHDEIKNTHLDTYAYLPTQEQWYIAATWDPNTQSSRIYPWGDNWNPYIINFSGYWSGCNITEEDWQSKWASNSRVYTSTRTLPVADLDSNISPVGCVQMLGNTWEWTRYSTKEFRVPIRGGSATSPMEHCQVGVQTHWSVDLPNEYISFRCCYSLRRLV